MENMRLPIALVGVLAMQLAGGVWWVSQQAATIEALTEDIAVLTASNSAADRTNLIRDVEQNSENIEEITDILVEIYEDMEDEDSSLYAEIDQIHEDVGSMASHMMAIVKLQSRISILENTVEFTRKDGI
jgi:ATPase subunit of ABC transporter with duplicated ATPase domains